MKTLVARDVMIEEVLAAQADWPLERLTEFLVENDISGAPVTAEGGALVGVVSTTDIVRHDNLPQRNPPAHRPASSLVLDNQYAEEEVVSFRLDGPQGVTVRDIMTPTLFTVREDTRLSEVADLMIKGRIHRVFVTRGHAVVGLVTALDMLKAIHD